MRKKNRGISMLMVLLVGTMVMLVSISVGMFALQAVKMSNSRGESIKALYTAEDAFACVRYWIRKDFRNFAADDLGPSAMQPGSVTCNNQSYTAASYTSPSPYSTSTFTIWVDGNDHSLGGVLVSVGRNLSAYSGGGGYFDGYIEVRGYNDNFMDSPRTNERMQRYQYQPSQGADIMFVVDRSGSIDGDRGNPTPGNSWGDLYFALASSTEEFSSRIPSPRMGLVSFGTDQYNTGRRSTAPCPGGVEPNRESCYVEPENNLAATLDVSSMRTDDAHTNLSLGLAIAGLELMGRAYPDAGTTTGNVNKSGHFERVVEDGELLDNAGFLDSPSKSVSVGDRDDTMFPDYIIVITDGDPNAIIRSRGAVDSGITGVVCNGTTPRDYPGDALVFHIDLLKDFGCIVEDSEYLYCNDSWESPTTLDFAHYPTNGYPNQARCNAGLVAEWVRNNNDGPEGVTIAAIGVGITPGSDTETWMKEVLASEPAYYASASNYGAVTDAILTLLERLNLIQAL